jgi:FKBP-type peptidyl-prolyl cis-trans isomerase
MELIPGVTKLIISSGEGGALPQTGERVKVHYEGRLEDGTVFDSSIARDEPFETEIGVG